MGGETMTEALRPARTFRDLVLWRKAHEYVLTVYKLTSRFPKERDLWPDQPNARAAVSIPANIAEGFVKRGRADKVRIMNIAEGSLEESQILSDFGPGLRLRTDGRPVTEPRFSKPVAQQLRAIVASKF
jgi:four helix bundle protein